MQVFNLRQRLIRAYGDCVRSFIGIRDQRILPRRFLLRAELDAALVHLYDLSRDETSCILDSFTIVRKNEERAHGDYRTKLVILDIYDRTQHAIASGEPYQTILDPPPADPRVAHPPRNDMVANQS